MVNKFTPSETVFHLILSGLMLFLMINYNLPLGTIYFGMIFLTTFAYYIALDQRAFTWIKLIKERGKMMSVVIGLLIGYGFIQFYQYLDTIAPLSAVFASAAFGESESVGQIVFGFLIPIVETLFFFRVFLQFYAWKFNLSTTKPFSIDTVHLMAVVGALFTLFHATSKGISDNLALFATFLFGAMTVFVVIYYREYTQATIAHIVVNAEAVGLLALITSGVLFTNPWVIAFIALSAYLMIKRNGGIKQILPM